MLSKYPVIVNRFKAVIVHADIVSTNFNVESLVVTKKPVPLIFWVSGFWTPETFTYIVELASESFAKVITNWILVLPTDELVGVMKFRLSSECWTVTADVFWVKYLLPLSVYELGN